MKKIDVSIVLNMHREAVYLRSTLFSLEACADEASKAGITVELIAVFDRSDQDTLNVFHQTHLKAFEQIKSTEIDVGSLGLARNAGITLAEGEFVWTADGDDLVSRNAIVQLLHTARIAKNSKVVVYIEFLAAFGDQYHVVRYFGSECLTPADFVFQHPFVSRIFIHRSAFDELAYNDLKVTTGFAYEDWDLNCRLLAQGYDFAVAPDTVFFYRQRANSLLKQANSASSRLIPHNALLEPTCFLSSMESARARLGDWSAFKTERQNLYQRNFAQELMASPAMRAHVIEAARLDPEVEPLRIEGASSYCPVPLGDQHWGFQLEKLYKMIGTQGFTDVVLLPWLKPGGAEKYILQILQELQSQGVAGKILVVSGQAAKSHEWVNKLPQGAVFIDLYNSFPQLTQLDRAFLIVRAMLAITQPEARLHLKASEFAHEVMERFGAALASHIYPVYYRFCDDSFVWDSARLSGASSVQHLRKQVQSVKKLVSDCAFIRERDENVLGVFSSRHHVVYANCSVGDKMEIIGESPKFRLLWASRICSQKRPELLFSLARIVRNQTPWIEIDVYGSFEHPYTEEMLDSDVLRYCGSFGNFFSLPIDRYDALIYTTAFDGLPNVILEAMGAGLPVIAPAIGGIPEAVIDGETGVLLQEHVSDAVMVEYYAQAIERIYADWPSWMSMSGKAKLLISDRHSPVAHAEGVRKAFEIQGEKSKV